MQSGTNSSFTQYLTEPSSTKVLMVELGGWVPVKLNLPLAPLYLPVPLVIFPEPVTLVPPPGSRLPEPDVLAFNAPLP
jgi:hypothetical protein